MLRLSSLSATAVKTLVYFNTASFLTLYDNHTLATQEIHLNLQICNNLCHFYKQAGIHLKVCFVTLSEIATSVL